MSSDLAKTADESATADFEISENTRSSEAICHRLGELVADKDGGGTQAAYKLAGRIANVGFWEWDEVRNRCVFCSEELARIHGFSVEQYLQYVATPEKNRIWIHPDDHARYASAVDSYMRHRQGFDIEYRLVLPHGKDTQVLEVVVPIVDTNNRLVRSFGFVKDISEQKLIAAELERAHDELDIRVRERTLELQHANDELTASKSQLREATRIAKLGYFRWSMTERRCIYRDEELKNMLGAVATDFENETTDDFLARIHPDDIDRVNADYERSRTAPESLDIEYRIVRPDGSVRYFNECSRPVLNDHGEVVETVGTMQDITERKKVSMRLAAVEERLSELGANAREVLYVLSADWREVIYVSKAFEDVWGRSCESLIEDPRIWYEQLHDEDRDQIYAEISAKMEGIDSSPDFSDARIVGPDGKVRWLATRVYPIRDSNGVTVRFAGVAEDITERKQATDALHHAQKLEAVGQLTGGVAHDFNNLLAVILGNTELLLSQCNAEDAELLNDVLAAGNRGVELTKRLLAYSRLQPLRPISIQLNKLLADTAELLRRSLGATITVDIECPEISISVYVDPGLLENALLNLALNSRDAMKDGGNLKLSLRQSIDDNGECSAEIEVRDTGKGMSEGELSRAFEPYFTTKEIGEGSGLGLSMVYGFVKQSRGDVNISSEQDVGTMVTISLPCKC